MVNVEAFLFDSNGTWFSLLMFSTNQGLPKFKLFSSLMFVPYLYFSATLDLTIVEVVIKEIRGVMEM